MRPLGIGSPSVAVTTPATYLRAAVTPTLGGWDLGAGVQFFGGTAHRSVDSGDDVDTSAWAVDAQAQGNVLGLPLGVYAAYALARPTETNVFNAGRPNDRKAWSILAELGVIPTKWTVFAGYVDGDTGAATRNEDNRLLIGTTVMLAQNVEIQVSDTMFSGNRYDEPTTLADNLLTVMLFMAF